MVVPLPSSHLSSLSMGVKVLGDEGAREFEVASLRGLSLRRMGVPPPTS